MPSLYTSAQDVFVPEVVVATLDDRLRTQSALISTGLATADPAVTWANGGNIVTRPEFSTVFSAVTLGSSAGDDAQKFTMTEKSHPVVSSITPVGLETTAVEDIIGNESLLNRIIQLVGDTALDNMDEKLLTYTTTINGGPSTDYGVMGTSLQYDNTANAQPNMSYDTLVKARRLLGDSVGELLLVCHSQVMADLIMTTEAKNLQQGVVLGSVTGMRFPTLGITAFMSDRTSISSGVYTSILGRPGSMSYAMKRQMTIVPRYEGNDKWVYDFTWRFGIMRNRFRGREMAINLLTTASE